MRPADIPNLITAIRLLLVVPFALLLLDGSYLGALVVFAVAGISDGIDGFLARRFDWGSRLGQIMDPLADKALMLVGFGALAVVGLLPGWLFWLILARDAGIVGGGILLRWFLGTDYRPRPRVVGKAHTGMQVVLVLAVIAGERFPGWPEVVVDWLITAVVLTTLASGVEYARQAVADWQGRGGNRND